MEPLNYKIGFFEEAHVVSGNSTLMDYIVSHSNEWEKKDRNGNTFLHYAAESGDLAVVRYLVEEKKMNVNLIKNYRQRTALHLALKYNKENVAEYLLQHGANVNDLDTERNSSLHFAASKCSVKILEFLISHGLNVNSENNSKEIPLHIAAENGNLEAVKYLVHKDASKINANDEYLSTPLFNAVNSGNLNIVKYLVEHGADVQAENEFNETPLHKAAEGGNLDIVKYLMNNDADLSDDDQLETPVHKAAKKGATDILKYFVQLGANLNLRDKNRNTVLHFAAGSGNLETVKYLIEEIGLSVEVKNRSNATPLYDAAFYGKLNIVKYLIEEKHAYINNRNINSEGILYAAILSNNLEIVKYMVEEQNVDIHNINDFSAPLKFAQIYASDDIVKFLELRIQIRNRRSIESFIVANVKPNFIPTLVARDWNTTKIGLSGSEKTIEHLLNSPQPLENSKSLFSFENFAFLGCIAEALNNSFSKRYNFLRSNEIKVVPSNQIAVNKAREEFDQFVENKIIDLSVAQQKEIREELKMVGDEINESLMRGVEFSGVHGLENVLELCKKCFYENLLP